MSTINVHRFKCAICPKHSKECDRIHQEERDKNIQGCVTSHYSGDTLCWCCKKSIEGGCDWIDKHQPVRHWNADWREHESFSAWHVNDCPEFERG